MAGSEFVFVVILIVINEYMIKIKHTLHQNMLFQVCTGNIRYLVFYSLCFFFYLYVMLKQQLNKGL